MKNPKYLKDQVTNLAMIFHPYQSGVMLNALNNLTVEDLEYIKKKLREINNGVDVLIKERKESN